MNHFDLDNGLACLVDNTSRDLLVKGLIVKVIHAHKRKLI